jgi:hypothetical protein
MAKPNSTREGLRCLCSLVLLVLSICSVRAHASQCDAPPYGDTQQNYAAILDAITRGSKSQPDLPPGLTTTMMQVTMQKACEAKFSNGDRTMFYQAGLSDTDINATGPAALTNAWFASRNKAIANELSGKRTNDCSRPPYGDTVAKFKAFTAKYQATDATSLVFILESTCRAKFDGGDRKPLYTVGLTDQEINKGSTTALAATWMDVTWKTLGAVPPSADGGTARQSNSVEDYQILSVREFVVDGPQLAAKHANVQLTGAYILQESVGMLYTDTQAVIGARDYPEAGTQPSVALLTDHASHQLRAALVSCDSNPVYAQVGCKIAIRGRATMCTMNNMFGATREVPCVNVEDGEYSRSSRTGP